MDKKNKLYALNIIVFLAVIVYFGVLSLLHTPPTESEVERRELAPRPAFSLAGYYGKQYTRDFDSFYADSFPGRDSFIKVSYALDSLKGLQSDVKLYQSNVQEMQKPASSSAAQASSAPAPAASASTAPQSPSSSEAVSSDSSQSESSSEAVSSDSSQSESSSSSEPSSSSIPEVAAVDDNAYLNNNIFIYQNAAYQIFYGDNASAERFSQIVSSYTTELPGVNVYVQVVPQPFNFYLPQKYRKMGKNELEYADFYQSKLTGGVYPVKVYQKLEENKDEYLYFRTDTHWTARGAYCAYQAFCEAAGFSAVPLSQMEKRVVPGDFLGYLHTITMDANLAKTPDQVEYFIVPGVQKVEAIFDRAGANRLQELPSLWAEDRRGGASYTVFIYGDLPYMRVQTSAGTGRRVLLIKDSYGNAFAPFLVSHYDEVHIIDERHFPYSIRELIEKYGIDDVIISQSSYSANSQSHQNNLRSLIKGHSGKALPDWDTPPQLPPAASVSDTPSSTAPASSTEGEGETDSTDSGE